MSQPLTRARAVVPWLRACNAIATLGADVAQDTTHETPCVAALLATIQRRVRASVSVQQLPAACPEALVIARFIGGMTHCSAEAAVAGSPTWRLDAPPDEEGGWGFGIAVNSDCSILLVLGHRNVSILAYSVTSGQLLRSVPDAGEFGPFGSLRSLCVVDSDDAVFVADARRGVVFQFSPAPELRCVAALSPAHMLERSRVQYFRYHGPSAVCADAATVVVYEASDCLIQELTVYQRADTTQQRAVVLNDSYCLEGAIVLSIALLSGGSRVAVCNQLAHSVSVFSIASGEREQRIGVFVGKLVAMHLAVSAFDEIVVACQDRRHSDMGTLLVDSGNGQGRFKLEGARYTGVAISRNGRLFAQTSRKCILLH